MLLCRLKLQYFIHRISIDFETISPTERYQFLTSVVVPRPIAWVTTLDNTGSVNAAPFSFFNVFGSNPAIVALGIGHRSDGNPKDTVLNIQENGQFVINMVTEKLAQQMVQTSFEYARGSSELEAVGLTTTPSFRVQPPRIAESPVHLECELYAIHEIGGNRLILGTVVHAAIDDPFIDLQSGHVMTDQLHPVGRMQGPAGYTKTNSYFEILRPKAP